MTNTDALDWEQIARGYQRDLENARLRVLELEGMHFQLEDAVTLLKDLAKNPYFWLGYFVALVVMLLIGALRNLKD